MGNAQFFYHVSNLYKQSGKTRIVVELPGIKDTARAKDIIGATATLEFKMVDEDSDAYAAEDLNQISYNSKLYYDDAGQPVLLKRNVILTAAHSVENILEGYIHLSHTYSKNNQKIKFKKVIIHSDYNVCEKSYNSNKATLC